MQNLNFLKDQIKDIKDTIMNNQKEIQEIKGRLKLLNYKSNDLYGNTDGNYSIYNLEGRSGVNKVYEYEITFISNERIEVEDIVDTDVEIVLEDLVNLKSCKTIFGKIYKASEDSIVSNKYMYKIEVVHPIYYLGLNNKYEIYHSLSATEIINKIVTRYRALLNISLEIRVDNIKYPIKDYTTQYNQSDLEFILMLCEEEGYSLIFKEDDNSSFKIVLCELNDYAEKIDSKILCTYNHKIEFKASKHIEDYYDKNNPSQEYKIEKTNVVTSSKIKDNASSKQLRNDIEKESFRDKLNLLNESLYEDLNRYTNIDTNKEYSQSNIIEAVSNELIVKDSLNALIVSEKENKEEDVIIIEVNYKAYFPNALEEYSKLNDIKDINSNMQYSVEFKAIPKDIIYKPKVTIKKPKIYGVQTAIVTSQDVNNSPINQNQNSIDVDEEGRVRVLFHFERNKTTSCYLRVSNLSSGNNYGSQFIPRVNSEVIVSFVNGNPDCPIIIGTLYNGENKIPYPLPANKTKSYIRTYTTPQYENEEGYNEILFEDKQGNEELNIKAQKDMNTLILNDETKIVKHNQSNLIENDKKEDVNNNSNLNVKSDYTINVKKNLVQSVDEEKITTVNKDYNIYANENLNIRVKNTIKQLIEKDFIQKVKGNKITYVEKDVKLKYLQNLFKQIDKDFRIDVKENFHTKANTIKIEAQTIELISDTEVNLKGANNNLIVNPNGIFMNALLVNTNSIYFGAFANEVPKSTIDLYKKFKKIDFSL